MSRGAEIWQIFARESVLQYILFKAIFRNYLKARDLIGRQGSPYDANNLFMATLISMFQMPTFKTSLFFLKIVSKNVSFYL